MRALTGYAGLPSFDVIDEVWPVASMEQRFALLEWGPADDPRFPMRMRELLREEADPDRRMALIKGYLQIATKPDIDGVLQETLAFMTIEDDGGTAWPRYPDTTHCTSNVPLLESVHYLAGALDEAARALLALQLYERAAPLPPHGAVCLMVASAEIDADMVPLVTQWLDRRAAHEDLAGDTALAALIRKGWAGEGQLSRIIGSGSSGRWYLLSKLFSDTQWMAHLADAEHRIAPLPDLFGELLDQLDPDALRAGQVEIPEAFHKELTASELAIKQLVTLAPDRVSTLFRRWDRHGGDAHSLVLSDFLRRYSQLDPDGSWREEVSRRLASSRDPVVHAFLATR